MKNLAQKADDLAARFARNASRTDWDSLADWEAVRDWVDGQTGGDLDCFELDLLTDAVCKRLSVKPAERTAK